jgi:hypothetical protein
VAIGIYISRKEYADNAVLFLIRQLSGDRPIFVGQFIESDVGRGCDTVGRSPLVREQPHITLLFIKQLSCNGPILVGQFVESDVGIRLWLESDAFQRVGDLGSDLGFLFAGQGSSDADVDVRHIELRYKLISNAAKYIDISTRCHYKPGINIIHLRGAFDR